MGNEINQDLKKHNKRVFGLDVLRSMAIMMVLLGHTVFFFYGGESPIVNALEVLGFYGVEIFFVLSGFLIGNILLRILRSASISFKTVLYFWIRRWLRTLPLYFFVLFVNSLLFYSYYRTLPDNLWKYFVFLQNFSHEYLPFFPESWSITIQEFAYVLAPVGLLFFCKIFKILKYSLEIAYLTNAVFLIVVFIFTKYIFYLNNIGNVQTFVSWNVDLKAILIYRLDSIIIGYILIYLFKSYHGFFKAYNKNMFIVGCSILLGLSLNMYFNPINAHNSFFWNVVYLPLNSAAISLLIPFFFYLDFKRAGIKRFIEKVSFFSYGMYLWNYTFISFFIYQFLDLDSLNDLEKAFYSVLYIIIVYQISKLTYIYFEKPLTDIRDKPYILRYFKTK